MEAEDLEVISRLKALLQERLKLHRLILFGSRARGDAEPDSDMDVLVILNEPVSGRARKIISNSAWEAGFDAGIVVVPVVVSRESWENGPDRVSLLAMAVREEGLQI